MVCVLSVQSSTSVHVLRRASSTSVCVLSVGVVHWCRLSVQAVLQCWLCMCGGHWVARTFVATVGGRSCCYVVLPTCRLLVSSLAYLVNGVLSSLSCRHALSPTVQYSTALAQNNTHCKLPFVHSDLAGLWIAWCFLNLVWDGCCFCCSGRHHCSGIWLGI